MLSIIQLFLANILLILYSYTIIIIIRLILQFSETEFNILKFIFVIQVITRRKLNKKTTFYIILFQSKL